MHDRSAPGLIVGAVALALVLTAATFSRAQAVEEKSGSQDQPSSGAPVTEDKLDSNFFDADNQKECDYPAPCGCNCQPLGPKSADKPPK